MATLSSTRVRLSASVRLILAMFQLAADIETQFGKYVLDVLKKQYKDGEPIHLTATQIGHMMVNSARKELQNDTNRAYDAVQEFLMKIMPTKAKPGGYDFRAETQKGAPGAQTWKRALSNILNNIRTTAMSMSKKEWHSKEDPEKVYADLLFKKQNQGKGQVVDADGKKRRIDKWTEEDQKELDAVTEKLKKDGVDVSKIQPAKGRWKTNREKTLDEAFGKRGEGGDAPSGGDANVPGSGEGQLGRALDDSAALKEFYDLIDDHVGDLKASLSPATRALFTLIFDLDVGGFGSDIKDNMGQASDLKSLLVDGEVDGRKVSGYPTEETKKVFEANSKRWSGFVGDTRKKLLDEIWNYIEKNMTQDEYNVLKETFFSDTTPSDVHKLQEKKDSAKSDEQTKKDKDKYARFKWLDKEGKLDASDKKSFENLGKKLKDAGVDIDGIEPMESAEGGKKVKKDKPAKDDKKESGASQTASIARRLASRVWSPVS